MFKSLIFFFLQQYFKQLGFSIDEPDDEEKTPLFWSVFAEYIKPFLLEITQNLLLK